MKVGTCHHRLARLAYRARTQLCSALRRRRWLLRRIGTLGRRRALCLALLGRRGPLVSYRLGSFHRYGPYKVYVGRPTGQQPPSQPREEAHAVRKPTVIAPGSFTWHVHKPHSLPSSKHIPKCEKIVVCGQPLQPKRPVWPALKPFIVSFPFTKFDEARWLHRSLIHDIEVIVGTLNNPFGVVEAIFH